jgi:hypothetical protein
MTRAMKWFIILAITALVFCMFIFVVVSSSPPGISTPQQDKINAYEGCLQTWGGWGSADAAYQNNCKQVAGITQ